MMDEKFRKKIVMCHVYYMSHSKYRANNTPKSTKAEKK